MSDYVIAGYASLFGVPDLVGDIVARGAFTKSLGEWPVSDVAMLFQHDPARPIGRWTGALEDEVGLWMQGVLLPHSADAQRVLARIQAGSADGLSIGFRARDASPRPNGGRILKTIDLREVSVVTFPMLPRARLRLRADPPVPAPAATSSPYPHAA
ncbi:MAG: hypothetical protein RLZZ157_1040 [Pseudomonadota bacterium]|jgi:HK97 family phage prohead protease